MARRWREKRVATRVATHFQVHVHGVAVSAQPLDTKLRQLADMFLQAGLNAATSRLDPFAEAINLGLARPFADARKGNARGGGRQGGANKSDCDRR